MGGPKTEIDRLHSEMKQAADHHGLEFTGSANDPLRLKRETLRELLAIARAMIVRPANY